MLPSLTSTLFIRPTFPSTCLSPDQPGYGQVVASSGRRRARRNPQGPLMPIIPAPDSHWRLNGHPVSLHQPSPFAPAPLLSNQYSTNPIYPVDAQLNGRYSPPSGPVQPRERHRYAPYPAPMPPPSRRLSASSRGSLSLDIPALSLHDRPRPTPSPVRVEQPIRLPAIQTAKTSAQSIYALPPISALEDLRGVDNHDSAAVLRRLQADDTFSEPRQTEQQPPLRRAISVPAIQYVFPLYALQTISFAPFRNPAQLPLNRRSLGQIPGPLPVGGGYPKLRVSVPSDTSRDSDSTCDPSPISPATPRSAVSGGGLSLVPLAVLKEQSRTAVPYSFPVAFSHNDWLGASKDSHISACRYSCRDESSEGVPIPLASW